MPKDYSLVKGKSGQGGGGGLDEAAQLIAQLIELQKSGGGGGKATPGVVSPTKASPAPETSRGKSIAAQAGTPPPGMVRGASGGVQPGTRPAPPRRDVGGIGTIGGTGTVGSGGGITSIGGTTKMGLTSGGSGQPMQVTSGDTTASTQGASGGGSNQGGSGGGGYGGLVTSLGNIGHQFTMDEGEKLQRANRHLIEQQIDIRRNFKKAYTDVFLPIQMATKIGAYNKSKQHSENYEYASSALKSYIEGSAGVWGGQSQWDSVWDAINGGMEGEGEPPEGFMEKLQYYHENESGDPAAVGIVNYLLIEKLGILPGIALGIANELGAWGNAFMKALMGE